MNMNIRKFGLAATGALMAFGSLFAATPATAAAGGEVSAAATKSWQLKCRDFQFNEAIPGGWTEFWVSCSGNTVTIKGKVYDSASDNRCIVLKVYWPSENRWDSSRKACPKGTNQKFTFTGLKAANPWAHLSSVAAG
ncbi:hypothetical protein DL991_42295 [Amycolatopsis sp. WAC 01375]|nr:hypothetical protein DL991_42295 [Amycolatopsis sp. WAC 01375]RSN28573.1 hypothetical protein DL990_28400 [Amycolatopsis sp. WAC 01416]